jgi:hypothetical protein
MYYFINAGGVNTLVEINDLQLLSFFAVDRIADRFFEKQNFAITVSYWY